MQGPTASLGLYVNSGSIYEDSHTTGGHAYAAGSPCVHTRHMHTLPAGCTRAASFQLSLPLMTSRGLAASLDGDDPECVSSTACCCTSAMRKALVPPTDTKAELLSVGRRGCARRLDSTAGVLGVQIVKA